MVAGYYKELLNFCLRTIRDRDAAADVVQETYARFLTMQQSDTAIREPRALLYQTARNIMVDLYRRGVVRQHDDIDGLAEAEQPAAPAMHGPDAVAASAQAVQAYLAAIEALPPRCREAFILHVFEDLPYAEIAARMGTSVSMIEKHIARGRLACRDCEQRLHGTGAAR